MHALDDDKPVRKMIFLPVGVWREIENLWLEHRTKWDTVAGRPLIEFGLPATAQAAPRPSPDLSHRPA